MRKEGGRTDPEGTDTKEGTRKDRTKPKPKHTNTTTLKLIVSVVSKMMMMHRPEAGAPVACEITLPSLEFGEWQRTTKPNQFNNATMCKRIMPEGNEGSLKATS